MTKSVVVINLCIPLYFAKCKKVDSATNTKSLLDEINFLSKLNWPRRILSFTLLIISFFFWKGYSDDEAQIIFTLSLINLIFYFKKVDSLTEKLNFLHFVENGIILLISTALAFVIYALSAAFVLNRIQTFR